ncbi:MAG TPA: outer membrane beta-barrel protein [Burkholderiales bacterium]|nr:outer membrane beta-barrel protein [Burkholderiales bacterium]
MRRTALRKWAALAGMTAALAPLAASADEATGWYVGAGAGQSKAIQYCDAPAGSVVQSCDDTSFAWKLLLGYQINRYLGVEAGYDYFGRFSATFVNGGVSETTSQTKTWAGFLEAVGSIPIGSRFSLFGKAGGVYWRTKFSQQGTTGAFDTNQHDVDYVVGAGVQLFVTKNLAVRAEYEYLPNYGNSTTGEVDLQLVTASVLWKF